MRDYIHHMLSQDKMLEFCYNSISCCILDSVLPGLSDYAYIISRVICNYTSRVWD